MPDQPVAGSARHVARRRFLQFIAASPLFTVPNGLLARPELAIPNDISEILNISQLDYYAESRLSAAAYHFIVAAADDGVTKLANRRAFERVRIRHRRLVDVSNIDTSVDLFGRTYASPIVLAPVGNQDIVHGEGDLATARAAHGADALMIAAMLANSSVSEIAAAGAPGWLQLYPSVAREFTRHLMDRASEAGCNAIVLTVDGPGRGNREAERWFAMRRDPAAPRPATRLGNFETFDGRRGIGDPAMTWDSLGWYRENTDLRLVLKGIVTAEDADLCVRHGVDGIVVSNHGGRQSGHGRGTLDVLPEIVEAVAGRIPVLIDGGIRRGADIFRAIALGADAACIGRPYLWGLGAFGEIGVAKCLAILDAELRREMEFAGTPRIRDISTAHVRRDS